MWVAAQPLIANGWNLAGIARAIAVTYQLLHTAYNGKRLTMPRGKQLVLARKVMALGLKPELKKKHMPDWEGRRQKHMEATQRIMSILVTLRDRGWTRRDVTNRTGIPITMVRHYANGSRLPRFARRKKLYALLEQRRPRRAEEIILAAMTRRAKQRIYGLTMRTLSRDTGYTERHCRRVLTKLLAERLVLRTEKNHHPKPHVWYIRPEADAIAQWAL